MKKTITQEIECCDVCEAPNAHYNCTNCGKVFCYEHSKTETTEYPHGVSYGGSGDGRYCVDCDVDLIQSGDKKHAAYRRIKRLRDEQRGWYEDFNARCKAAEKDLHELLK